MTLNYIHQIYIIKYLLLHLPITLLRTRNLNSNNRTPAPASKNKNHTTINRGHLLQLRLQLLIIPWQFIQPLLQSTLSQTRILNTIFLFNLNIKLNRLSQPTTAWLTTFSTLKQCNG
ncbi:hypothetical protein Hanom_Chr15g01377741 [Helianthus anomalus]